MDVLLVHSYDRIEERIKNQIWALSNEGYDVQVLLWDRNAVSQKTRTEQERDQLDIDRFEFEAPNRTWTLLLYLPLFYILFGYRLFQYDYDVIHCCHPSMLPICVAVGKLRRRRVVYDVFELHIDAFPHNLPSWAPKRAIRTILVTVENLFVALTDGVVTIDTVDDYLVGRYKRYNENSVALNNVPRQRTEPDPGRFAELQWEYEDTHVIVHVGGISRPKGILQMVAAVERVQQDVPNLLFLCIGEFRDDSRDEVEQYVHDHDLDDVVEFREWMPFEDLLGYLAVADVGLALYQPHFRYRMSRGNSRKIFTYMNVGLPIVASASSGISEIVSDVDCGIVVDETDPDAVAQGVLPLLDDPGRATELGRNGKRAIEERYNWEREREKLLSVYERATQQPGTRSQAR